MLTLHQKRWRPAAMGYGPALPRQVEALAQRTEALSILFDHTKGAFPGAEEDRVGLLQRAQGGTLFFDEVGLLPLPLQAHLLRVLTRGEVRRTDASEGERLDVRVLAASSEDVEMQVEVGGFNRELFDYLAVHQVAVPPLRDRREDIAHWHSRSSMVRRRNWGWSLRLSATKYWNCCRDTVSPGTCGNCGASWSGR